MEILSLGEKIKRRRKELDMTLKDLAGDRITPGQISLVESGKSNPSMDLLEYLADTLKTSVEYLMESEESQAEKICLYYENIAEANVISGNLTYAEQNLEMSIYYSEKYNLEYRKARNLYLKGQIHVKREEYAAAQQFFLSANVVFIKYNYYEDIINTFINLGKITYILKAYHSSNSYFQQAEKAYTDNDVGNDFLMAEIYYYTALTYFKLDNIEKSINYSFLAKEKFQHLENKREYGKTLMLLSEEYSKKGDIENAIKYSKKTLSVFKELNDIAFVGEIENNLGKLFFEFENIEESFKHLNRAKEIREKNNDANLNVTLINICENYIRLKDVENCNIVLAEIIDNIKDGDNNSLISYYLLKYRVNLLENNLKEAENTLLTALKFAKNMDLLKQAAEISVILGKFYIDNKMDKEAAKYLNEGVEIFKEIGVIRE
ncbi:helix-turn-helix domain-containing protein [Clostridium thermarum]|uniref:helix-turn-helix domain-containing protein n=1 Tax=Clostridium thermarum TaxID=1716543 RepID=UPI00111D763B|nr:helix-turn-helix transcriptional regulator [Clostridium thermarum]